tara:strand:+ start:568 stop:1128 length:561 start_codon:yes stop_codon:yes gene_type:complete
MLANMTGQLRGTSLLSNLPNVQDPESTFANITRQDYDDYIRNFRGLEDDLLGMTDDTSLIDRVPEDVERQMAITRGIRQRNLERYGGAGLSRAQLQEQERALQRSEGLNLSGGLNVARVNQRATNMGLLRDLVAIGQGVNQDALAGLGNASANAAARRNAYKNAKRSYSNNMLGLGSTFLLAAFGI